MLLSTFTQICQTYYFENNFFGVFAVADAGNNAAQQLGGLEARFSYGFGTRGCLARAILHCIPVLVAASF